MILADCTRAHWWYHEYVNHYIVVSRGAAVTYSCPQHSWSITVDYQHQDVADEQLARHLNPRPEK